MMSDNAGQRATRAESKTHCRPVAYADGTPVFLGMRSRTR